MGDMQLSLALICFGLTSAYHVTVPVPVALQSCSNFIFDRFQESVAEFKSQAPNPEPRTPSSEPRAPSPERRAPGYLPIILLVSDRHISKALPSPPQGRLS